MRSRAPIAVAGTATGLVALLSLHSGHAVSAAGGSTAVAGSGSSGATPSTTPTPPTTSTPSPTNSPSTASNGTATTTKTVQGDTVQTQWGPVQVQVTAQGTKVTDVQALQLPSDHFRSQEINNYAAPILRQEALAAQSSTIDTVSGATVTSDGYTQSLQSALDKL